MKFIKLTPWDPASQPYFVNMDRVTNMQQRGVGDRAYTMLEYEEDHTIAVKETPEQILALLSQPTAV